MVTRLGPVFTAMAKEDRLTTYVDEKGRTLYDVPGGVIADEDLDLPVVMLGMYDNVFLSHADRDRIATDEGRRAWMGVNGGVGATLFVDGLLAGLWRIEDDTIQVEPFGALSATQRRRLDEEKDRVAALLAR
jgi:hypothetical protein